MTNRLLFLLAPLLLPPSAAAAGAPAEIALTFVSDDEIRVIYETGEPVSALKFARVPDGSRPTTWRAVDDAFEIRHDGENDIIRRKDGASFRKTGFDIHARYSVLEKDYAPFSPFSDGGMLIYSGRFHACAGEDECSSAAVDEPLQWRISIMPPRGARTIVNGALSDGLVSFGDNDAGTNIYVGRAEPVESSHVIGVIDAAFPEEARESLMTLLPRLMDLFTEKFGPLDNKPMLFASLDPYPPEGSGFDSQGGALPDQIFIHLYGEMWATNASEKLKGRLPWFFAHEAAHLFQRMREAGEWSTDQSWIHEGGAEALAALAVEDLGAVESWYVEARIAEAFTRCSAGLERLSGKPLNASAQEGAFENYYACGLLMQLAIDAEIKSASDGLKGLYDVWARFLERVSAGAEWEQEVFLAAARDLGAIRSVKFARSIANNPLASPREFLRAGIAEAGVPAPLGD